MSALRSFVSDKSRRTLFNARALSPAARRLPDFLVIGAQKSGTSSMFAYLDQHPQIHRPLFKEPYFFDRHYDRGLRWYARNFPSQSVLRRREDGTGKRQLTFEATATYVFDPNVPERIARDIAARKFVLLLRNPVDRVVSAYWHARRLGIERRSLADALQEDYAWYVAEKAFEDGLGPKPQGAPPRPHLRRGIYHEAVTRWLKIFSREDLLILQSETLFARPTETMARVFAFLGLDRATAIDFKPRNTGAYEETDREERRFLAEFYAPHNERLNAISGAGVTW